MELGHNDYPESGIRISIYTKVLINPPLPHWRPSLGLNNASTLNNFFFRNPLSDVNDVQTGAEGSESEKGPDLYQGAENRGQIGSNGANISNIFSSEIVVQCLVNRGHDDHPVMLFKPLTCAKSGGGGKWNQDQIRLKFL